MKRMRFWPLPLLLWPLAVGTFAQGQSLTIGYTNCLAVDSYSVSLMNQIGQAKWYFAQASVGDLMLEGLSQPVPGQPVLLSTPVSLQHQQSSPQHPVSRPLSTGTYRGHSTLAGLSEMTRSVPGGLLPSRREQWLDPVPGSTLAMNILSFIDIWYNNSADGVAALLSGYMDSMTNLEAAFLPDGVRLYDHADHARDKLRPFARA